MSGFGPASKQTELVLASFKSVPNIWIALKLGQRLREILSDDQHLGRQVGIFREPKAHKPVNRRLSFFLTRQRIGEASEAGRFAHSEHSAGQFKAAIRHSRLSKTLML